MPSGSKGEPEWRVFRRDTEAGRLLSRLYGTNTASTSTSTSTNTSTRTRTCNSTQDEINYPQIKTKDTDLSSRSRWNSGSTYVHSNEEHSSILEKQKKAASVRVPKVGSRNINRRGQGQGHRNRNPKHLSIEAIPRRKTQNSCNEMIEGIKSQSKHYRPPITSDHDKDKKKLCDEFENGGGKCLPLELTALPSSTTDTDNCNCVDDSTSPSAGDEMKLGFATEMANQIVLEIQERRAHQLEMEKNGAGEETMRVKVVKDIAERMRELMMYDPAMAKRLMNEW